MCTYEVLWTVSNQIPQSIISRSGVLILWSRPRDLNILSSFTLEDWDVRQNLIDWQPQSPFTWISWKWIATETVIMPNISESYVFGATWKWVNDGRISYSGVPAVILCQRSQCSISFESLCHNQLSGSFLIVYTCLRWPSEFW